MTIVEKAVQWAINTANDNSHGYSQASRWGPDFDCSSFVISAYRNAGLKLTGATYTGNMRSAFLADGFADVTTQCGLSSGYGVQAGDVLLNYAAHTCMSIGNGKVANCRTSEGNTQTGDQSGNEIRIQSYWDGSPNVWNCVLRYKGSTQSSTVPTPSKEEKNDEIDHSLNLPTLRQSNVFKHAAVIMQAVLNERNFPCGTADGVFGPKTAAALNRFQAWAGLEVDSVCGPLTWTKLLETG